MFRTISVGLLLLLSLASAASAADLKGRVAAIDLDKQTIALRVADQEHSYNLAKECSVYQKAGARKDSPYNEAHGGLKAITVGDEVTATTDLVDGSEQVIRIKIDTPPKRSRHRGREISGKVASIDAEKRTIGLSSSDKEQKYTLASDCNVFKLIGNGSRSHFIPAPGGLSDVTVGAEVTLNLDTRDGKEEVVYIEIGVVETKKDSK